MKNKLVLLIIPIVLYIHSAAQADTSKAGATTISGSVDVYYRANTGGSKYINNYTSFTNSSGSFELGMASIRADHSFGKVSATADLGFGRRAEEFSYNETHSTLFAVKQVYVTYAPSSAIKFTMGKWGTHIGYEVMDAFANRNYSMDYMFSEGPFFHTGLKADISLGGTTAFMIGIANPTDFSTTTSGTKVAIAQFSTGSKNGKLKAYLNFQGYGGVSGAGPITPGSAYILYRHLTQFDVVANATINSNFSIGYNGTVQTVNDGDNKSWWGSALYFNYDPVTSFGLTLRTEYFNDKDGVKLYLINADESTTGSNVFDATLSGNIKINSLTIIPELRLDNATQNIFTKANGSGTKTTVSALLAAVYKF
ncbi:MAG TPA: outer membrane beta-barrel protein [Chitinophagaceae bacterium]|nr:outer membrane beta-barrel protein [Chitinophagaceae bacterium]